MTSWADLFFLGKFGLIFRHGIERFGPSQLAQCLIVPKNLVFLHFFYLSRVCFLLGKYILLVQNCVSILNFSKLSTFYWKINSLHI